MEIEGHPTQDLIEELQQRGAVRLDGDVSGPNADALRFLEEATEDRHGLWLFLPHRAFMTGFDEPPV